MKPIRLVHRVWVTIAVGSSALNWLAPPLQANALENWTTNQVSTNHFGLSHVTHGGGRYVAIGEYSDYAAILSSDDGLRWTLRADGRTNGNPAWGLTLTYSDGRFAGVNPWAGIASSTNGIDWTFSGLPYGFNPSIEEANPGAEIPGGLSYGQGVYVAVGSINNTGAILASSDGIAWNPGTVGPNAGGAIADVVYGAGKFVAVGNNDGNAYTSTSGTSWTRRSIRGGSRICFCNGLFLVPYGPGTNLLSADGIDWTAQNTGITSTMGKVAYSRGSFMARAGNALVASADGSNWVQYATLLPGTSGVASDGSRLVTVGSTPVVPGYNYNGYVYVSEPLVGVRMTNTMAPQVVLSGLVGRSYRIESTDILTSFGTNHWQALTTLQLSGDPYFWTDATATNTSRRFYRGLLLP